MEVSWVKYLTEDLLSVRTLFAAAFYGTAIARILQGQELPDFLVGVVNMLLGYYFGSRQLAKANGNGAAAVPARPPMTPSTTAAPPSP